MFKGGNIMKCTKCGYFNPDGSKFCSECGNSMPLKEVKEELVGNLEDYEISEKVNNTTKENNAIAVVIKVIACIILVLGFILGFLRGEEVVEGYFFRAAITVWITYSGIFLGLYALAEIIQILHDIRYKVWKRK